VGVHSVTPEQTLLLIDAALQQRARGFVSVTGVHGVMEAARSADFRALLNRSFLVTPDGMPTVWVGRLQGYSGMQRVYGPDLMLSVCRHSVRRGHRHFLYGGKPGVAERLRDKLNACFPGLNVVGVYSPPFRPLTPAEEDELIALFDVAQPDITWVGLSTPKQERFMAAYLERLNTKLMIGVGAAFDIHTGGMRDAPRWVKQAGLQWMHRLFQEPQRLWKRYFINNPLFIYNIALQLSGIKEFPLEPPLALGDPKEA
jgi:N-acetylglucosaminyldiphosphoundecaprenol N-acetyl-beta-D-mannosaminyltransferase